MRGILPMNAPQRRLKLTLELHADDINEIERALNAIGMDLLIDGREERRIVSGGSASGDTDDDVSGQRVDVTTQDELDQLPADAVAVVREGLFLVSGNTQVEAYGTAQVWAYDSAQVRAHDQAQVWAYDSAQVRAHDQAQVWAYGLALVEMHDQAQVWAYGLALVEMHDQAQVRAHSSARVWAFGRARVRASDDAQVWTHGQARVVAASSDARIVRDEAR